MQQTTTTRPRWYYGWNVVGALILSQIAANSLSYNAFPLFVRSWARDLHAPVSEMTLCIPALLLVAAPLSPVIGALADRYPPRRLFSTGLVGMGIFYVLVSFSNQPWQIILLFAVVGAPALTLCSSIPANALITRWFVRRRGFAIGLGAFGLGLGGVILPPIVAVLLPAIGWRMIWLSAGLVLILVVMPVVVLVIRNAPTAREGLHYLEDDGAEPGVHAHGFGGADNSGEHGWRRVLSRRNFWLLVAIYLMIMGTGSAFTQNMGPIVASHGFSERIAGLLLAVLSAASVGATLLLGLAADRFGPRIPLVTLALAVAGGIALLGLGNGPTALIIGAALVGCNSAVFTPLGAAMADEFGPDGFGRAFGMALFFLPITAPTSFILARLQELAGSYAAASLGFIALLTIAMVLCLMLRSRPRMQPVGI